jgi:hypothetical protein
MNEFGYRDAASDVVSQLVGNQGIKASLTVKISPLSITALAVAMIIAVVGANVVTHFVLKSLK